jgi:hypothetical protein
MENKEPRKEERDWHPLEYAHVFLWLVKDMCWVQDWTILGSAMVVPTVSVAYIITWHQRHKTSNLVHNLAISLWITSNSLWMLAEFFGLEELLKPWASVGFGLGLSLLAGFYTSRFIRRRD